MQNILKEIVEYKKNFVARQKSVLSLNEIKNILKNNQNANLFKFEKALQTQKQNNKIGLIAEIKKASPSRGIIANPLKLDVSQIAKEYINAGCNCISVLTDERYFLGSEDDLLNVVNTSKHHNIPILQKDFVIDEYQIYKAKLLGADCILLILSVLDEKTAVKFEKIAHSIGLNVLCETHNESEIEIAKTKLTTNLIGINNRNLSNFEINLDKTKHLFLNAIRDKNTILICESGIETKDQINLIKSNNCSNFLIGTSLMLSSNKHQTIQELINV